MNKNELISAVAEKTGITKKDAERIVSATFETITTALSEGNRVQIAGFGIFETKTRAARTGRNPVTKQTIQIPESRVPAFKASKTMKDQIAK